MDWVAERLRRRLMAAVAGSSGARTGWWAGLWRPCSTMVLFWALIITAVVLIVRYLVSQRPTGTSAGSARTPEEVLAERYARGEIDDPIPETASTLAPKQMSAKKFRASAAKGIGKKR